MLDRITHLSAGGGKAGLGVLRGEKDVDPREWFFKAHFFQDPVQPGSLGLEAMAQLLQFHMLHAGMHRGREGPRFEPVACGPIEWKFRGQVLPTNGWPTVMTLSVPPTLTASPPPSSWPNRCVLASTVV